MEPPLIRPLILIRVASVYPVALSLLFGLGACDPDEGDDDSSADQTLELTVETALSELVPSVILVSWSLDVDGVEEAFVEYGYDAELGRRADAEHDGQGGYRAALLGLRPDTEVHLRAGVVVDGETTTGDLLSATTGSPPPGMPEVTIEGPETERMPEGFLVTSLLGNPPTAVVLDTEGNFVWWYRAEEETYVITRAHFGKDGKSIVYLGAHPSGEGEAIMMEQSVVRVALDGSEVSEITVLGAQRDFHEHEDGTVAMLVFDVREVEGEDVVGDRILEVHPDGSESEIWNVWDQVTYDPMYARSYCHANALDYDAEQDTYFLSCHRLDSIFKIDRSTGETLWRFGGDIWYAETGDFTDGDGETHLLRQQHQFQILDDGILVFNNQTIGENYSNVLEYGLDWEDQSAELRWEYVTDPAQFCYVLGDVDRFPGGETLVTWSTAGRMEFVSGDGDMLWRLKLGLGAGFGYTTYRETLYANP